MYVIPSDNCTKKSRSPPMETYSCVCMCKSAWGLLEPLATESVFTATTLDCDATIFEVFAAIYTLHLTLGN